MQDYREFLKQKHTRPVDSGFEPEPVTEPLYPFQRTIVEWAIRTGRAAVFADTGLGKTRIQLAWARQVCHFTGRPVLILAPLAVNHQTIAEAKAINVPCQPARSQEDVSGSAIVVVTNYEMLDRFDVSKFGGVVLDESSILKSFMGKTKQRLIDAFAMTPWRLCCTATPAPNDHVELTTHAEFLGVLRRDEILARWFINDSFETGKYRLKSHARSDFWEWVHSWALSLSLPSDLGDFDDSSYLLPDLDWREMKVAVPYDPGSGSLFPDVTLSATTIHQEMRRTAPYRADRVSDLVALEPDERWVIWCNTNYEADEIMARIPDALEVRGSESLAAKEAKLSAFSHGDARIIVTKPTIAGFGLNWQHCARVAFVGLSYSYEQLYQAVRRTWRFGQSRSVHAYVITAETEQNVVNTIKRKELSHREMKEEMNRAMRRIQRGTDRELKDVQPEKRTGQDWELWLGDSVELCKQIADEAVGLSVFSPPFSNLFVYSDAMADMGNCKDDGEFIEHFSFLIRELKRVTQSGRLCAVHCSDLPKYKYRDGVVALNDLPGTIIRAFQAAGWEYHSRVTIWKNPVTEMQRTKAQGLLYKQLRKDSSASRVGMPDYVIVFRKWDGGEFANPITKTHEDFPLDRWQQWASPVWFDINQTNVLQYRDAKSEDDERHICPLQLEVIERCIKLWSNPGDLVLDPFAGIGSTGHEALRAGRRFVGIELKRDYFEVAERNLRHAAQESGSLFDWESGSDS